MSTSALGPLEVNEVATSDPNMKNSIARPMCNSGLGSMRKTQKAMKAYNRTLLRLGNVLRRKGAIPAASALRYGEPVLLIVVVCVRVSYLITPFRRH